MEFNLNRKNVLSCFLLTAVFNTAIALFLTHMDFGTGFRKTFILSQSIGLSICAAVLSGLRFVTYFFISREKITQTEAAFHAEQIKRLTLEKTAPEGRLRILQAQIEPHFLFNSLSNIMSLLDGDLARGKRMLTNLTHYLRRRPINTPRSSPGRASP